MTFGKMAVIGAGTMGCGIAQVAATAGHEVVVIDPVRDALDRGRHNLLASLGGVVKRSKITQAEADQIVARIGWSQDVADVTNCALVIEAIVERLDIKRTLFADLAKRVAPDAILASNTSSLSISAMAEGLPNPGRFIGLHFFNPVPAMKLVEIIASDATDPALLTTMSNMMRDWGKHAVVVRDVPGFIVNRVARPFYAEAFQALEEGVPAAAIDAALSGSGGFRMGPLALADMIGHDVNYAAAVSVFEAMSPDTRFRPQPTQARLVEEGRLGRKSGHGVYDYPLSATPDQSALSDRASPDIAVAADAGRFGWLGTFVSSAPLPDMPSGSIAVNGMRMAYGDGRPLAERDDIDVLLDFALDPASARVLVATVRGEAAATAVDALAQTLGKTLILIPDRPGQLVLRTWAQLANGAADAARDQVASVSAIDDAMIYGANYPQGPLAWASLYGVASLKSVLTHIAEATGDDLYRPSTGLI